MNPVTYMENGVLLCFYILKWLNPTSFVIEPNELLVTKKNSGRNSTYCYLAAGKKVD